MLERNIEMTQQISDPKLALSRPRKLPQYIAGLASTLGALAGGMVIGWSSPAGEDGIKLNEKGVYPFDISVEDFSWIGSVFNLGAVTICVPIGVLSDMIGRKTAMLLLTVPYMIGWACVIWPNNVTTLIIGRYFLGLSSAAFCVTVPMYTAEIADSDTRGRLGSYFELLLCIGVLASYVLGSIEGVTMFALSMVSAVIPLIFCAVFFFMPETPIYHLMKGNVDMARSTLTWLRGSDYDVEAELDEHREVLAEAERNKISFFVAIRTRAAVKGLVTAFGLMFFQQTSGINAIIFYAGSIFKEATGNDADWPTVVIGAMQVIAVFVSSLIVDRLGRRLLLMVSGGAMCVTTLIIAIYFYMDKFGPSMENARWLPLVCLCGFIILISLGFGPIPWTMMGEIFSPQIKGVAGSSACLFNWLMSFVITKFYSDIKMAIGSYGIFWIFSAFCALSVVFVYYIVPETKGKTLEEIQAELNGDSSPRKRRKTQT